jgi:N-acetylglucosamine-6-phosphate deacetylase
MRIENVQILMSDGVFRKGSVEFGEAIQKITISETTDAYADKYLIPGLVDIHTHGALGGDHTDASLEQMEKISSFYAKGGTTSFLATTMSATEEVLAKAMSRMKEYSNFENGARYLGINLEGPFFSHPKRGAHPARLLQPPSISMFERLYKLSGEQIRIVCLAPELNGGIEFIKEVSPISRISLAHSTADYDTAMEAFAMGATHVTHLFNGMNSFLHREPGIIGAALDSNAFVEVICDGYHLHPAVIRAIFKMFSHSTCLISDSIKCTGQPDGNYEFAGSPVTITNGQVMLQESGTLAGSSITLLQGVRTAVSLGIPLANAVMAASASPAKAIGMEDKIGTIKVGAYADMLLLDSELQLEKVYINGKEI